MGAYTCPKGHSSTESDFCSDCGAKMQTTQTVRPAGESCPECRASRAPEGGSFCEVCGHNFAASAPVAVFVGPPVKTQPPPKGWTATVIVDPSLREPESPVPPEGVEPYTIALDKPVILIGRRSESRAVYPEIALNFDAAVSHRHALLEQVDGALVLRDIGAANGTRLNGKDVTPLIDIPLHDGDRITLGHWTSITVKAVHG
jgi:FHA domain